LNHATVALRSSGKWLDPVVTEVSPAEMIWRAEEYHQRYLEKNGADQRLYS
jgi:peptide-methionine (S)-S-oxide reductase